MDTTTLWSSIARILQRDVASALTYDGKTIQKQVMKPINSFLTQASVRLYFTLLSWSSSAVRSGMASGVPRQPLILNVIDRQGEGGWGFAVKCN